MDRLLIFLTATILLEVSIAFPRTGDIIFPDALKKTATETTPVPSTTTASSLDFIPELESKMGDVNMLNTVDENGNYYVPIQQYIPPEEIMAEAEGAYFRPLFVYRQQQAKRRNHNNVNHNSNHHTHHYEAQNRFSNQNYNSQYNNHWRRSEVYKRSPAAYEPATPVRYYRTKFNRFLPSYRFRA